MSNQGSSIGFSLSNPPEAVKIWFKLDKLDYDTDCLNFSGESVVLLRRAIKDTLPSLRDFGAAQLKLFVIHPETGEQTNLFDLEKENIRAFNLNGVIIDYKVGINNPIIIKLPDESPSFPRPPTFSISLFTNSTLPHITHGPPVKSATRPVHGHTPLLVTDWITFLDDARAHVIDDNISLDRGPGFITTTVCNEAGVGSIFDINVLANLRILVQNTSPGEGLDFFPQMRIPGSGNPDYTFIESGEFRFFIEVKTPWNINPRNIVEQYNYDYSTQSREGSSSTALVKAIRQCFGYMGDAKLKYCVLSTYEKTFFMYRPNDSPGSLLISDCIERTSIDPTLFRCFMYMMSLSRGGNHFSPTPPLSPLPPPSPSPSVCEFSQDDDHDEDPSYDPNDPKSNDPLYDPKSNSNWKRKLNEKGPHLSVKQGCRIKLEQFNWGAFNVTDELGQGRCGTVYKAIFRGEEVALKIGDIWQYPEIEDEMMNEAKTYIHLEELQGVTIPKLKGVGYTGGGLLAIATELAGSPIQIENLCDSEKNQVVKALSSLHDHNVLHGDIRQSNILMLRYERGHKIDVKFIDLAYSRRISDKMEARKEMIILKRMLGLRVGGKRVRDGREDSTERDERKRKG